MNNDLDHLFRRHSAKIVATLTRVFGSRHLDWLKMSFRMRC
jgi:hypothetical protein